MAQAIIMPRQGISVESCLMGEWMKQEGDAVKAGDTLFTYETDKAAFEEESPVDGVLLKRFYKEGDEVPCLNTVCVVGEPGEDIGDLMPEGDKQAETVEEAAKERAEEKAVVIEPVPAEAPPSPDGALKVSPRAKNLAEQSRADLRQAVGSGPGGRIIERDVAELIRTGKKVNAAEEAPPAAETATGEYTDIPLTNMRKIVGKAMYESLSNTAQLTLHASFDATQILAFRQMVKDAGKTNITLNDILLYAVSRTITKHPELNAHYLDGHIRQYHRVHLGIATDTERGLMVPTLFGAEGMGLNVLSQAVKNLIEDARTGHISPDYLSGATFTVTNLGVLGVESFTPVLNPPQTGILGVCAIKTALKGDGKPYQAMGLSLTFDHRATDGAPAARFLKDLCRYLEAFTLSLAMESVG